MSHLYSQIPKAYEGPKSSGLLPGSWFLFSVVIFWNNCRTGFVKNTDFCPCGLPSPLTAEQECQAGHMNALVAVGFQLVLLVHMKAPQNKLPSAENRTELCGRKQMEDTPQAVFPALCPLPLFIPGCAWDRSHRLRTFSAAEKTGESRKPFAKVNEGTKK